MNVKNSLISMTAIGLMIVGCGGGGGTATTGGGGGNFTDNSRLQGGTARVDIDLVNNTAKVTPINSQSRAVFGPGSVSVSSAEVFRTAGASTSSRVLRLTFKNNTAVDLGTASGLQFDIGAASPNPTASTVAGIGAGATSDGSVASAAVGSPNGVWIDNDGTFFISQGVSGAIRQVKNGTVSTLNSLYNSPRGLTGNPNSDFLYFCETGSHRIVRLRKDGNQGNVVAGTGVAGDVVGAGASARFNTPIGLTSDPATGTLYVADYTNGKVKAIANPDTAPTVSTLATGIPTCLGIGFGTIEGRSLLVATSSGTGQVFLIDPTTGVKSVIRTLTPNLTGATIRENRVVVASSTNVVTVLRSGSGGSPFQASNWQVEATLGAGAGFADGASALFSAPQLMSSGTDGLYMCDSSNHRVRSITLPNFIGGFSTQPAVFTNTLRFSPSGRAQYDLGTVARGATKEVDVSFNVQFGASMTFFITVSGDAGTLIPVDGAKNAPPKNVYLRPIAGKPDITGTLDGQGANARMPFNFFQMSVTDTGYVFVGSGRRLQVVDPSGKVTTIGNTSGSSTFGTFGNGETITFPSGEPNVYVNRQGTKVIFAMSTCVYIGTRSASQPIDRATSWNFSLIAGAEFSGDVNGTGDVARFDIITGIAMNELENEIYVVDFGVHKIKRIVYGGGGVNTNTNYTVNTFAGSTFGFTDGFGSAAQFNNPVGLALDRNDNLYVGDRNNFRIRKITRTSGVNQGTVTTLVGTGVSGNDDVAGTIAPDYLAIDDSDSIYMAKDSRNLRVYRNGQLYTVLLQGAHSSDGFAENVTAEFRSVAVNRKTGDLYIGKNGVLYKIESVVP